MSASFSRERLLAELAVQRASILSKKVLSMVNKGEVSKADMSPVTIADFAAQALIISAIHAAFPSDTFVGEESADALRSDSNLQQRVWELVSSTHLDDKDSEELLASPSSIEELFQVIDLGGHGAGGREGRVWMLDPIDGTATFIRREQYAVSLALVVDGVQVVGVLGCPNLNLETGRVSEKSVDAEGLGLMLSAVRGEGASIRQMGNGGLLPATKIEKLSDGPTDLKDLHFVFSTFDGVRQPGGENFVAKKIGVTSSPTEIWSSHMRYVALIVGGADVLVRMPVRKNKLHCVWDHAGSQLIYTEVGGKVTDLQGNDVDFGAGRELSNNWGIVAAKPGVHSRVLEVVAKVLKDNEYI